MLIGLKRSMLAANELAISGILGVLVILVGSAVLSGLSSGINVLFWTGLAMLLWAYVWLQAWQRRDLNRENFDSPCLTNLGWANRLTLLRGWLIALTGGFLLQPLPYGIAAWLPGALYGVAAILDRVDGSVARRSGRTTLLGKELDTEMDALGLLVAPLLALIYGKFHWSFLTISLAYYVFMAGLKWRRHKNLPVYPLPPSTLRRTLAGFQMGFVAVVLLPPFPNAITLWLGFIFMVPILIGFLFDWFAVSGYATVNHFRTQLAAWSYGFFQPLLRVLVALLISYGIFFDSFSFPILFGILALLIIAGIGARTAAGVLLLCWSATYSPLALDWVDVVWLMAITGILLLGAGQLTLWRKDDLWVDRA